MRCLLALWLAFWGGTSVLGAAAQDQGYLVEHFNKEISFRSDGTWLAEQSATVRVGSSQAVRRFGTLCFGFKEGSQTVVVVFARVRKNNGQVIETPGSDSREVAASVTEDAPVYSDLRQKQLPLRSLEPGDILEYQVRYTQFRPEAEGQFWYSHRFSTDEAVADEQLTVRVPRDKYVQVNNSADATIHFEGGQKVYRWSKRAGAPAEIALTTFRSWSDLGAWYAGQFEPAIRVTPAIQSKADELTRSLTTEDQKQRALYYYVSSQFRYVAVALGAGKYRPQNAAQVLANGYGDCKDKHTLLAALLKAEGIAAWPALVGSESVSELPTPANFDHVVTVVGETWMDTTAEIAPFGLIQPELRGVRALLLREGVSAQLVTTPNEPSFAGRQEIVSDATLSADGTLHAHMQMTLRGDDELTVRSSFHRAPPARWTALMQGLLVNLGLDGSVSNVSVSSPEDGESPFHLTFDYEHEKYSDWANLRIAQPVLPFIFAADESDAKPMRRAHIGMSGEMIHRVTLHLPPGLSASLPNGVEIDTPFASYESNYTQSNDTLIAERRVKIKQPDVAPADWERYVAFVRQVKQTEGEYTQLSDARAAEAESLVEAARKAVTNRDFEMAGEQLGQAARLNPKQAHLWSTYAELYSAKGEHAGAIAAQRRAISEQPGSDVARLRLAELLFDSGASDEARQVVDQVVDGSNDPAVLNNAACLLSKNLIQTDQAVAYARRAVELMEKRMSATTLNGLTDRDLRDVEALSSVWETLGNSLTQAGDGERGRVYLEAAWQLTRNRAAHDHLRVKNEETARSFSIESSPGKGSADFFLLFAGDRLIDARFVTGSESLKQITPRLLSRSFPPITPDAGPERIVRRAVADCSDSGCRVTLLLPAAATKF